MNVQVAAQAERSLKSLADYFRQKPPPQSFDNPENHIYTLDFKTIKTIGNYKQRRKRQG